MDEKLAENSKASGCGIMSYLGIFLEERGKTTNICLRFVPSIIDE